MFDLEKLCGDPKKFYKRSPARPVRVLDPLMAWANDAQWSMGGLNFKRQRLHGRIEGSIKKLKEEAEREKTKKNEAIRKLDDEEITDVQELELEATRGFDAGRVEKIKNKNKARKSSTFSSAISTRTRSKISSIQTVERAA